MSNKIKTVYMAKIDTGEKEMEVILEANDGNDAFDRIRNHGLFDHGLVSFSVEKKNVLFSEEFFALHKNDLFFPTHDDPFGKISVIEKHRNSQALLSFLMIGVSMMGEDFPLHSALREFLGEHDLGSASNRYAHSEIEKIIFDINNLKSERLGRNKKCQTTQ